MNLFKKDDMAEQAPWAFFIVLLLIENNLFGRFFPNRSGLLGHDFSLAHPALLDGAYWFWKNGILDVPWFTPSFCGGQPFFADPQTAYYSPLQWLTFFFPPTLASHLTLLLALALGYWSYYFLARRIFDASKPAAILAGSLAMLNGFIPYRFLIGELGYQLYPLTGFVALALLAKNNWRPFPRFGLGNIFWAGLTITMMLQGGLTTLMIPAALGALVVALLAQLRQQGCGLRLFLLRGIPAVLFAVALCAAKLVAGATFMSHFPRESYMLPGFSSAIDAMLAPFYGLILNSETAWNWAMPRLTNVQWSIFPHEWAYQFGFVYVLLLVAGLYCYARRPGADTTPRTRWQTSSVSCSVAIIFIMALPSLLLWYSPAWNAFLKSVPLINSTSFPFRWIIIWIPPCCIAGAFAWQQVERCVPQKDVLWLALLILIVAMVLESTFADKRYYDDPQIQSYRPAAIDDAWKAGKNGQIPDIRTLDDNNQTVTYATPNDSIITGASFIHCYNPAYGYRQETLPTGHLLAGQPVMAEHDGRLNIKNPACLIWPDENQCTSLGDEYHSDQREQAGKFVQREPIHFAVSQRQQRANTVTLCAWLLVFVCLAVFIFNVVTRNRGSKRP